MNLKQISTLTVHVRYTSHFHNFCKTEQVNIAEVYHAEEYEIDLFHADVVEILHNSWLLNTETHNTTI